MRPVGLVRRERGGDLGALRGREHIAYDHVSVAPERVERRQLTPCTVEFVMTMLFAFVPTAVPAFVTLPLVTLVQCPPVLPVIVESVMRASPRSRRS